LHVHVLVYAHLLGCLCTCSCRCPFWSMHASNIASLAGSQQQPPMLLQLTWIRARGCEFFGRPPVSPGA
jgi:hypothetical protein